MILFPLFSLDIIIVEPFLIASSTKSFPLKLSPTKEIKMKSFFTNLLLSVIPEIFLFRKFLSKFLKIFFNFLFLITISLKKIAIALLL